MTARVLFSALLFASLAVAAAADDGAHTFTVQPPAPTFVERPDGFVDARIEGWERLEGSAGGPQLPSRTFLVAIPPGATPRLEVRSVGGARLRPGIPSPIAREVVQGELVPPDRPEADLWAKEALELPRAEVRRPDPRFYAADAGVWPESVARLGEIGVLRDQRYVAVHVSPVRWDPAAGGLRLEPALELTVHFDGARGAGALPAEPGAFESVYRSSFVNYAQGRAFRMTTSEKSTAGRRPDSPPPLSASSTTPRRRVLVEQDGIVRIDHALVSAEAPEFLAHSPVTWRVTRDGVDVPVHLVQGGADPALLEAGEWLQFHGEAFDDEPRMELIYDDTGLEDLYAVRDVTDVGVYFLTIGSPQSIAAADATPGVGTPEADFRDTARIEADDVFMPLADDDTFYDLPILQEMLPKNVRTDAVPLPGLAAGDEPLDVRVRVRGASTCYEVDPDHETRVSLRNATVTLLLPSGPNNVGNENVGLFDGLNAFQHEIAWTHDGSDPLASDPLFVRTEVLDLDVVCPSIFGNNVRNDVFLNWIEIDYTRSFDTDSDLLAFDFPDQAAEFEITGFASSQPEVWEVTGVPVRLTGAVSSFDVPDSSYTVRFGIDNDPGVTDGEPRRFVVFGDGGVTVPGPASFAVDRVSDLVADTTPAGMVVIFHPDVVPSACSISLGACSYDADCPGGAADVCEIAPAGALAQYTAHRVLGGIDVRTARIGDVADEFNGGRPGPDGISAFLGFLAGGGWSGVVPEYVLLVGDGSYVPKDGTAAGEFVPTQLVVKISEILPYYASDNLLGAVTGADSMPDFAIGRLPARTPLEAERMLDKIRLYESATASGPWREGVLFVSDRANDFGSFEALEFERINQIGVDAVAPEPYDVTNVRYWTDFCGGLKAGCGEAASDAAETAIKDAIDTPAVDDEDGVVLVQYAGHGNFDLWSSDVLVCTDDGLAICDNNDDSEDLDNGPRLPFMLVHNCLTGGFHTPELKSFGEQFLKRDGGGAVGVLAPSGLGFRFIGESVTNHMWDEWFGATKTRGLAAPILRALAPMCANGTATGTQACQFYTLLGDPSMRLALPHVGPPTNPTATPSTGPAASIQLDWDASATAGATYDVFRQTSGSGPYFDVATGHATADYLDSTVVHQRLYRYYVVASDSGFKSAWSNFNVDCGGAGPDCIEATPVNTVPPVSPTVIEVSDVESGGAVFVEWVHNPEPDIDFYTVHWGLTPATPMSAVVQAGTDTVLTGLDDGVPLYIAVSATNTSALTSLLSTPLPVTPNLVLGLRSPALVSDLRLGRAGSDAALSWSAVALDVYGKIETVSLYEVYRGLAEDYVPAPGDKIGETAATSLTDALALDGGPDYFYLLRAVDVDGNPGGLGRQLPQGIVELSLALPGGASGDVLLEWPAVTTDFDGGPTTIVRYEVWGSDTIFSRADIEAEVAGIELLDANVTGTSLLVQPSEQKLYYSVLAVDSRGNRSPF